MGQGRAVVFVLDDVHWGDPATLELVEHLVRRPPTGGHLLAMAARPGTTADRLLAVRQGGGARGITVLDVGPLERSAAQRLLPETTDRIRRDRLLRESGGNPLLLGELARAGDAGFPAGSRRRWPPKSRRCPARHAALCSNPPPSSVTRATSTSRPPSPAWGRTETARALDALVALDPDAPDRRAAPVRVPSPGRTDGGVRGDPAGTRLQAHAAAATELARVGAPLPVRARHLAHAAVSGDVDAARTLEAARWRSDRRPRASAPTG